MKIIQKRDLEFIWNREFWNLGGIVFFTVKINTFATFFLEIEPTNDLESIWNLHGIYLWNSMEFQ